MKVQVLMSVMNQKDHSILNKANIQTDTIIINQCDKFNYEMLKHRGRDVLFMSLPERGVGLSRNTSLMRADSDVVIFSDDDIEYVDGYEDIVRKAYAYKPKADMILFNVPSRNKERRSLRAKKWSRLRWYNCFKYGTFNVTSRLMPLKKGNHTFSLLFGGGSTYSHGEDSLFIYNAIKSGLNVYVCPITIAYVSHNESTWFEGYNDKFFYDKGVLFKALMPRLYVMMIVQFIIRKNKSIVKDKGSFNAFKLMLSGARSWSR